MKLPLPSFSRRSMEEKLFCILLGGLMASACPEDGRWARIFPSGWRDGKPKTGPHLHVKKSDEASPCIPFSLPQRLAKQGFDGTRWCRLFRCLPKSERKIEYTFESSVGI